MRTTLLSILLLCFIQLFAQTPSDSIVIKKMLGTTFLQHGKILTPNKLSKVLEANPEAYKEMKTAKTNNVVGTIFGAAGGFLVGFTLGTALGGGKPSWVVGGVGAGLIGIGIPFSIAYTKHAKNAVKIYNAGLKPMSRSLIDLQLGLSADQIGFRLSF